MMQGSLTDTDLSFNMGSVFYHLKLVIVRDAVQIKHLKAIPDEYV